MNKFLISNRSTGINSFGQTTIEYILLLSVVMVIILTVMNNPLVQRFTAKGNFIKEITILMQFSYRHSRSGNTNEKYPPDYSKPDHVSYSQNNGESRFFGPASSYPDN